MSIKKLINLEDFMFFKNLEYFKRFLFIFHKIFLFEKILAENFNIFYK